MRHGPVVALALLVLAGCRGTLSPLSNKLKVGQEAYVAFVADGEAGQGDLFASPPVSGTAFQVTFTRLDERAPALSPDGATLAFLRAISAGDTAPASLVFLNLLNGAERRTEAPPAIEAVRWSPDGRSLFLRGAAGLYRTPAPPAPLAIAPVTGSERARADSLFRTLLGDPPLGEAGPCASGAGVCARLTGGDTLTLSADGSGSFAWSSDSVGYFEDGGLVIRPLAGGKTRTIRWQASLAHPRQATWFPGTGTQRDSALH